MEDSQVPVDPLVALLEGVSPAISTPQARGLSFLPDPPFGESSGDRYQDGLEPPEPVTLEQLLRDGLATTVIYDKLYFASVAGHPKSTQGVVFFSTDYHLRYSPYFADFGPLNVACLVRFSRALLSHLRNPAKAQQKIVYYSGHSGHQRANSGYLIACFCVLALGYTAAQTHKLFAAAYPPFLPFRDASYGVSTFNLTLLDCLEGLEKAKALGWIDVDTFDLEEYTHFDAVDQGDWNWIVPRQFIAFSSPVDGVPGRGATHVAKAFRERKVRLVLRLNECLYDRRSFTTIGIDHVDMMYPDGSAPSDGVANECMRLMEKTILGEGCAVAVHCKAGLGRTGTIIALYLMKHYGFSARECIAWCRICRPGCVIGQQQQYLEAVEQRMRRGPLHAIKMVSRHQQEDLEEASSSSRKRHLGASALKLKAATPLPATPATPLPASVMPSFVVKKTPKLMYNNVHVTTSRLAQTRNAAEAHRAKLEAKASLYDETFEEQDATLAKFKYPSSAGDALKSSKSPTRKAVKIESSTTTRRLQGELTGRASSSLSVSGNADALGQPLRAASQLSFASSTRSALGTADAVSSFARNTLQKLPVTTSSSIEVLLPDVTGRPSRLGSSGPGWLRPTEHPPSRSQSSLL